MPAAAPAPSRSRPRGAAPSVVAIDLSPTLVGLARERTPGDLGAGQIEFRVGDMLDPALGRFDHVVAMDSLIHYVRRDIVRAVAGLAARADALGRCSPSRPAPRRWPLMHAVGRLFPRGDRAPAIEPVGRRGAAPPAGDGTGSRAPGSSAARERIARGFYTSQALELRRA